jgi:hypothetical protein
MTDPTSLTSETVSKCACKHMDSRECYIMRYPPPMDDLARAEYFGRLDDDGEYCPCGCHDDYEYDLHDQER